ncbi:MAG: hypothetical protein SOI26_07720 [Coriobacteriales bacterium]|jgi:hypothetical protein
MIAKRTFAATIATAAIIASLGCAACIPASGQSQAQAQDQSKVQVGASSGADQKSAADKGTGSSATDGVYASYSFTSDEQLVQDTAFLTDELGYNPHDSHFGTIESCGSCHGHGDDGSDELWCTTCHMGAELPDGWSAYPAE